MRRILPVFLVLSLVPLANGANGDQTTVDWANTLAGSFYSDAAKTILLSEGTPEINGDGFVLQLGYYDQATTANNFLGTWVPLTGEGSANTAFNTTSIGDDEANVGLGDGLFSFTTTFVVGSGTSGNNLPSSTAIPLAIRFYNSDSIATATAYGAVSNDAVEWLWKTPAFDDTAVIDIAVDPTTAGTLEWQGGGTGYYTNQPIPEPSAVCLAGLALAGLAFQRRKR
jgi:hypothetical protein